MNIRCSISEYTCVLLGLLAIRLHSFRNFYFGYISILHNQNKKLMQKKKKKAKARLLSTGTVTEQHRIIEQYRLEVTSGVHPVRQDQLG